MRIKNTWPCRQNGWAAKVVHSGTRAEFNCFREQNLLFWSRLWVLHRLPLFPLYDLWTLRVGYWSRRSGAQPHGIFLTVVQTVPQQFLTHSSGYGGPSNLVDTRQYARFVTSSQCVHGGGNRGTFSVAKPAALRMAS